MAELADAPDLGSGGYTVGVQVPSPASDFYNTQFYMRKWLSGRASPCQGEGREFESRLPLQYEADSLWGLLFRVRFY